MMEQTLKDRIDEFLSRSVARWVAGVLKRARLVSIRECRADRGARRLRRATARNQLRQRANGLADSILAKIAHEEFSRFFPNLDDALLIVIDAETPALARESVAKPRGPSGSSAARDFTDVYIPGGGSFFERNGLLYRSVEELDLFADQMARAPAGARPARTGSQHRQSRGDHPDGTRCGPSRPERESDSNGR